MTNHHQQPAINTDTTDTTGTVTTGPTSRPRPDPLSLAYEMEISPWRQQLSGRFVRGYVNFWGFVGAYWLTILNVVNGLFLAAAFAAPLLLAAGWNGPAQALYTMTGYVCVQNPQHSFYLVGRQMCLCQRCTAIYGGLLLAGLGFHLVRRLAQPLKLWQFGLLFCLPIGTDGFTQLFGWRESTWELRLLTGAWFALGAVWTLYPLMENKMGRLRRWSAREQALTSET